MARLKIRNFGTALSFNGTSARVAIPSSASFQSTTAATFIVWAKWNSLAANAGLMAIDSLSTGLYLALRSTGVKFEVPGTDPQIPISKLKKGQHFCIVGVFNDGGLNKIYLDGTLIDSQTSTGTATTSGIPAYVGSYNNAADFHNGIISEALCYKDTALSAAQVSDYYYNGTVPTAGLAFYYKFDEGAGTSATDSSGNGNTGTITAATYTADVPMKPRKLVNDNLVRNGSFEFAPPFVAAQTATSWIDGSATGSGTNNLFRWSVGAVPANGSVCFDPTNSNSGSYSIKLDKTAGGASSINILNALSTNLASASIYEQTTNMIPVYPNVSYTLTFYYKQTNKAGGTVQVCRDEFTGASTTRISFTSMYSDSSTSDLGWTKITQTFTTSPTTNYLALEFQWANATTGTVWCDDITLKPTYALEVR